VDLELPLTSGAPRRRQLEQALRLAIRSGRLQPGASLPPSRVLADELGVSRGVVVESYSQLVAEGYLSARQGSGTRVARLPAQSGPPEPRAAAAQTRIRYDLRPGQADFHAFPRDRWRAALLRALRELPDQRLSYEEHRGCVELRSAVAEHASRVRGVVAEPERVLVCSGVSHGLSVLWRTLRRRGARRVAIEDPSWRWQRLSVESAGLEAVPVRVDAHGLVVSELAAVDVNAVVLTPAHQYPTAVVTSPERRRDLLAWARVRDTLIVEDDYDAEYRFDRDPVSAMQGLAPDHVAYLGTASKTLAPALRLGWLIPPAWLVAEVEHELMTAGVTPPTIEQVALAGFIADGGLERHLRRMRGRYRARRERLVDALARHLPEARVGGASAGLHLVAWLPEGTDEAAAAAAARREGVGLHELHRHCDTPARRARRRSCSATRCRARRRSTTACGCSRRPCRVCADQAGGGAVVPRTTSSSPSVSTCGWSGWPSSAASSSSAPRRPLSKRG
jgi:GntR family transcriptional regulator/MocR family aminotransferase